MCDYNNFLLITNLMTISKILERLALSYLKPHSIILELLRIPVSDRAAHSTKMVLVKMVDDILCNIDSGQVFALVGLNISVAFDTVNHDMLLCWLQSELGVSGTPLMDQLLPDWQIFPHPFWNAASSPSAVLQESVIRPLLFTTYIAPICRLIKGYGVGYHKYADDTQLNAMLSVLVIPDLTRLIACTYSLHWWFWRNDLLLNSDKSEACFFRKH